MIRRVLLSLTTMLVIAGVAHASGAAPEINIQGRVTDLAGNPLPAGIKDFTFRIYNLEVGGPVLWSEVQSVTTDVEGLWSTRLGVVDLLQASVFADSVRWLSIEVDDGVNPPVVLPRVRLVSSPYAFHAGTVDGASGGLITSKVTIGGNHLNTGLHAFVTGFNNDVTGDYATVTGGTSNTASDNFGTVGGGQFNDAQGTLSTVAGGGGLLNTDGNVAINTYSTVGGGGKNLADGLAAVVTGGFHNSATDDFTSVNGGYQNIADSNYTSVGGGYSNLASGMGATVGGGLDNDARDTIAVVAGGGSNTADGEGATVGGGGSNSAENTYTTVAGGWANQATGLYATVPGGIANVASGNYTFAAGRRAKALNGGCFVWGDRTDADFSSTGFDQFLIRADGGVGIGTNDPQGALSLTPGPNSISLYLTGGGTNDIAWANGNNLQLGQWDGAIFTERARFTGGNGYLGIGVTSIPNVLTLPNINGVGGDGLAHAWDVYSSRRWKTDIEPIGGALSLIERLRGVRYRWKDGGGADIGLIAEEVGEVVPEVVQYEANGTDARSVDYSRLVAVLIQAVKEQQAQIHDKQKQIDELRTRVERLTQ